MKKKTAAHYQRSKVSQLYVHTAHGVYYARARNAEGKDTWRTLETTSFEVARTRLPAKLAEIQAGRTVRLNDTQLTTFQDAAEIYRTRVRAATGVKPSTIDYRLKTVAGLVRSWPELFGMPVRLITADACFAWASRYRDKVHGTRFNNTVDSLRGILDVAKEYDLIKTNPAERIQKAKVTPKKLALPSREQFHGIVTAIRNTGAWCAHDAADLVEFLAYSGCRITEAAYTRWSDVDGAARTIRIHGHEVTGTKNTESRSIPITPPMRDLLDRLSRRDHEPRNSERHGRNFIVYVTECRKALTNACKTVGAKRITHHDLRHLFATRCIEAGVDIPTIARWLGHKDGGALLMKTYGHLRDEHSQSMAAKVTF